TAPVWDASAFYPCSWLLFSSDSRLLLDLREDYENWHIGVWNVPEGRVQSAIHDEGQLDFALAPDGCSLLTVGRDQRVHRWDTSTGMWLGYHEVRGFLGFIPGGERYVSLEGDRPVVRDLVTEEVVQPLAVPAGVQGPFHRSGPHSMNHAVLASG